MQFDDVMEREMVLMQARDLITGDRARAYGPAKESFGRIAAFWSAYLGMEITPHMVGDLMGLMKYARNAHETNFDNYVDICGYASLSWECSDGD